MHQSNVYNNVALVSVLYEQKCFNKYKGYLLDQFRKYSMASPDNGCLQSQRLRAYNLLGSQT